MCVHSNREGRNVSPLRLTLTGGRLRLRRPSATYLRARVVLAIFEVHAARSAVVVRMDELMGQRALQLRLRPDIVMTYGHAIPRREAAHDAVLAVLDAYEAPAALLPEAAPSLLHFLNHKLHE